MYVNLRGKLHNAIPVYALIGVLLFGSLVPFLSFMSSASSVDLIVGDSETRVIGGDYVLTGNIHLKENGVLIIAYSNFRMHQFFDNQYALIAEQNSKLIIRYANFTSNYRMNIVIKDNATINFETAFVSVNGNISISSVGSVQMLNSSISTTQIACTAPEVIIDGTNIIAESEAVFNVTSLNVSNSAIKASVLITNGEAKFYDASIQRIAVIDEGLARIYRTLVVHVLDRTNMSIPNANVNVYRNTGDVGTLVAHATTDKDGIAKISLLTETFEPATQGPVFLGNYFVNATYENCSAVTNISFTPYEPDVDIPLTKSIILTFKEIIVTSSIIPSSNEDLILKGNQSLRIENNSGEFAYMTLASIFLENNATLQITGSNVEVGGTIYLKQHAKLILANAKLNATRIYIQDNATALINNSVFQCASIIIKDGSLDIASSEYHGNLYATTANISITDTKIFGETLEVQYGQTMVVENSTINTENTTFLIDAHGSLYVSNISASGLLFINAPGTLRIYNVTYKEIHATNIELYHYLIAHVTNGNNRSVPNATVRLYRYIGANLVECANGTTNANGIVIFSAQAKTINTTEETFTGNYMVSAYHELSQVNVSVALTSDMYVVLHFVSPIIPPFNITTQTAVQARALINETLTITGTVFYNHGPETVRNATISLKIAETGDMWNATADANGRFSVNINAPLVPGKYTLIIEATDQVYNYTNISYYSFEVVATQSQSIWENPSVVYGTSTLAAVIIILILILVVRHINRRRFYVPPNRMNDRDLVGWAVETMHKRKED